MGMKNPPHPGEFVRAEIIEPAGLSVTAAAAALQVSRPVLSSLLNGKADLSGDMALRIEKAFGVKMDTLMRMQASCDIAQTRIREKYSGPANSIGQHSRLTGTSRMPVAVSISRHAKRTTSRRSLAYNPTPYEP
jgi:antitoxin HigA-1